MSFLCSLPLAAQLFSACAPAPPLAVGYVEGDYVLLAPIEVAQVETVAVKRGDRVAPGTPVVTLESADAEIAVAQAEAALAQAQAQLADLRVGKRPEEIAVLKAEVDMAKARAADARRKYERASDLFKRGTGTQADYDTASTTLEAADAQVGQAESNLAVGGLPARPETINAADSQVKQAQSELEQARWRLSKRVLAAPFARTRQRCHPQSGRYGGADRAGDLDAAGRRGEAQRLCAGKRVFLGKGRRAARRPLRRLRAGPEGAGQLCVARSGIHTAGDLFAREPAEAGLSGRGAAGR